MSDNEDLLGDDLGDHSLADYNLGNDEEDQLLADDYEVGSTQSVPSSLEPFRESADMVPSDYSSHGMEYIPQPVSYQPVLETECVVPNIVVEVANIPQHSTYAPYEPRHYEPEHSVPPAMPAAPIESPQIVPSEIVASIPSDMSRERFISERPVGAQRMPQVRDIPDNLELVMVPGAARRVWRSPHYAHPYRRSHMPRANFPQRNSFPPMRAPPPAPQIRREIPHDRPMEMSRPPYQPNPMEIPRPQMEMSRPQLDMPRPPMEMPRPPMEMPRPPMEMQRPPFQYQRFQYREERPMFNQMRPQFERPMYFPRQQFQRFGPPMPQIICQNIPDKKEPEIRMLPVPIPGSLPSLPALPASLPGALAGKKVLINPHFKGTFQPPVEGPIKDIDDAAERFIAEQRNALARAAGRKFARRSPQRYIENTTIEIENELARRPPRRRSDDDDLLRRQEEFIHANRAGLRRRMRSPSPPAVTRRSPPSPCPSPCPPAPAPAPAPRRDPERERRHRPNTDDSMTSTDNEYKRRVREQENMRERVLRAKEVRRRKNAAIYIKQMQDREREERDSQPPPRAAPKQEKPANKPFDKQEEEIKPDTTRKSPDRDWTPELDTKDSTVKDEEVNSTCEDLTPPPPVVKPRVETPPLASDDELDLILGDIDGILSDDDDILTPKPKISKPEPPKPKPLVDLRAKLPPKPEPKKPQRQKIIFTEEREEKKKKEKSPPRRPVVSSTKGDDSEATDRKSTKTKSKQELSSNKSRQRIIFEKDSAKSEKAKQEKSDTSAAFSNRRVILQRKPNKEPKSVFSRIEVTNDPSKPNPGIFSRAVRTIGERERDRDNNRESNRIVIKNDAEIEYDSSSDEEEHTEEVGNVALVDNLPHGMTDTRLKTLAGDVQMAPHSPKKGKENHKLTLILDKEERSAKIFFKTSSAAENFKKKFNNKMVAASRLTVTLE